MWTDTSIRWLMINGYWLFLIPLGIAFDRYGALKTLAVVLSSYGILLLLTALKPNPETLYPLYFLTTILWLAISAIPILLALTILLKNVRTKYFASLFLVFYFLFANPGAMFWLLSTVANWNQSLSNGLLNTVYIFSGFLLLISIWVLFRKKPVSGILTAFDQRTLRSFKELKVGHIALSPKFWTLAAIFFFISSIDLLTKNWVPLFSVSAVYGEPAHEVWQQNNPKIWAIIYFAVLLLVFYFADRRANHQRYFYVSFGIVAAICAVILANVIPLKILIGIIIPLLGCIGVFITIFQYKLITYFKGSASLSTFCGVYLVIAYLGGKVFSILTPQFHLKEGVPAPMEYEIALYAAMVISLCAIIFTHKTWKYLERTNAETGDA
ncbi:MAG: hypothetical protein CMM52_03370 [Rhodospirillaceae bacterium]|nr:hypothetical protein [Rhodospirillaceae bacterium]|tara:strand:- start:2641 stop:3786 length:1146 start_codon:yes stop_codon:yes gene_type:complete